MFVFCTYFLKFICHLYASAAIDYDLPSPTLYIYESIRTWKLLYLVGCKGAELLQLRARLKCDCTTTKSIVDVIFRLLRILSFVRRD